MASRCSSREEVAWTRVLVGLSVLLAAGAAGAGPNGRPPAPVPPSAPAGRSLEEFSIEELMSVPVTAIATGSEEPVTDAPAVTTVITDRDLVALGATTLEEALETVPGLHVSRSAQGYAIRYLIRGISTTYNPQVLLMMNGIPLTSLVRGDRGEHLEGPPIHLISRIEVIRGPGSALYGADAFAGVINVVTKSPSEIDGTHVGGLVGNFNTRQAWLLHGESFGDLDVALMVDFRTTDGHRRPITADAQTRLDALLGTRASLAPGPVSLSRQALNLLLDVERSRWRARAALQTADNVGLGQGLTEALDPNGRLSYDRTTADLTFHDPEFLEHLEVTSQLSYYRARQEVDENLVLFPPGANLGSGVFTQGMIGNPEYWEHRLRFDHAAAYTLHGAHRLRAGAGYSYGRLYRVQESKNFTNAFAPQPALVDVTDTPDVYLPEKSRHNAYAFGQAEWQIRERLNLTAGVRYDYYSDFGSTVNPRLALVWKATSGFTSKVLYGRAFRAPSFAELYTANNPVALGNPKLLPETNSVVEVAFDYRLGDRWSAGLNVFHYDVSGLITFVKDASGVSATARNFADQTGNGFEVESRLRPIDSLLLIGNYAFQHSTNENAGKPAGVAPKHQLFLRGDWVFLPGWSLGTQFLWVGDREREPGDPRPTLKGYTTVDLVVRRVHLVRALSVTAAVRNLMDSDVREPSSRPGPTATAPAIPNDLPQAGRSGYLELSYEL